MPEDQGDSFVAETVVCFSHAFAVEVDDEQLEGGYPAEAVTPELCFRLLSDDSGVPGVAAGREFGVFFERDVVHFAAGIVRVGR